MKIPSLAGKERGCMLDSRFWHPQADSGKWGGKTPMGRRREEPSERFDKQLGAGI